MKTACILTAGVGNRLKNYSKIINKSLLPINKQAAITKIIEKFPKNTNFIIALGHFGDQVKNYLQLYI